MPVMAKAAFAHRTLWAREARYRFAFVLGPPVVLGALLGGAVWTVFQNAAPLGPAAPWAVPKPSGNLRQDGTPVALTPTFPLPDPAPDGGIAGLARGWAGLIVAAKVTALGIDIMGQQTLGSYVPAGVAADMTAILSAGPSSGTFVGVQSGFVRIATAGRYGVTLRLERDSYARVDCVARLGMVTTRLLSQNNYGLAGKTDMSFEPVTLDLQPGLYETIMAFGCRQNVTVTGPGRLTLMVRGPGQEAFAPMPVGVIFHAPEDKE